MLNATFEKVIFLYVIIIICLLCLLEMVSASNTNALAAARRYCSRDNRTDVVYRIEKINGTSEFIEIGM